jgi:hypothetical protein
VVLSYFAAGLGAQLLNSISLPSVSVGLIVTLGQNPVLVFWAVSLGFLGGLTPAQNTNHGSDFSGGAVLASASFQVIGSMRVGAPGFAAPE